MQPRRRALWLARVTLAAAAALAGAAGPARAAPPGYPVSGVDVSAFQGQVDWAAVAAGGAKFAYLRASEQANVPDSSYAANMAGARANGLYVGAYHRARPDVSGGRAQADFFLDTAGYTADGRTLPPALDIEWPRTDWTGLNACYNLTPAQLVAWIREFVDEIARRTGRPAMIYTNPNWWNPCTASNVSFGSNPLWNSGYTPSPPPPPAGWSRWTLWQYADSGSLPGDQDVFNGDDAGLARLANPTSISLRAHANGRYVTAEDAGAKPLIANRTRIGAWERFDQVDAGGGDVALFARANGRYVTAEDAGAAPLIANRTRIGTWERFDRIIG